MKFYFHQESVESNKENFKPRVSEQTVIRIRSVPFWVKNAPSLIIRPSTGDRRRAAGSHGDTRCVSMRSPPPEDSPEEVGLAADIGRGFCRQGYIHWQTMANLWAAVRDGQGRS